MSPDIDTPEARSLRQAVEALAFEGILTPVRGGWRIGGLVIRAAHRMQAMGRPRLLECPRDPAGRPIDLSDLARGLAEAGHDPARLERAVRLSARRLRQAGPVAPGRLALTGLALEAALIEGHPYHPAFKARLGFSDADNAAFGPESARPIRPLWLAVEPALVTRAGTDVAAGLAAPGAVPVHPWQWTRLAREVPVRAWLDAGRIRVLGEGPPMQSTASLRTLAPLAGGDHLKLSLGVRVTSSRRDLVPWSVPVAPAISDWLARLVASDPALAGLTILAEHGAAIVASDTIGGRLAVIRRSAPPGDALPLSALSLAEPHGGPLIAPWLDRYGARAWTARFLSVLRPVWHLMVHHGVALEAHGQNLLLMHDDGWPTGLVARDFSESLEYVPACLARPDLAPDLAAILPELGTAPDGRHHRMARPQDLRDLVMDCLATHVLADLADRLHRSGRLPESAFWDLARAALPPAPAFGTDAPTFPAERLAGPLLGRAAPHPIPNPLRSPPMTTYPPGAFRLDQRLVDPAALDLPDLPLDRAVALHVRDRAAGLALILRLRAAGGSCLPIHPETTAEQARDLARRAGCGLLVHDGGIEDFGAAPPPPPGGELYQTSSGTTGAPRLIARSWAAIETEIEAYVRAFPEAADMTPVIAATVTHSYGLIAGVLVGQARGHVPVVLDSANPRTILRLLEGIKAPLLYAAPPLAHVLARLAGPGGLHAVMCSGTVLPLPWFQAIQGAARHLFQQYGCSEAGCLAIAAPPAAPEDMGAPLPHVRLEAGHDAPGPVIVHGAGAPVETGDLGRIDARGHLIFAGRAAEVIDVAGLNVYPAQIEAEALALPGIADAVAFAVPDPAAHQRPALAYAGEVPEEALERHLAFRLSPRQRPVRLIRLPALPRGANGKISRAELSRTLAPRLPELAP